MYYSKITSADIALSISQNLSRYNASMANSNKQNKIINENRIINLVAYGPFIFIPAVIIFFSFLIISASNDSFEKNVEKIDKNLRKTQSKTIKARVESIVDHITYDKSVTEDEMKKRIKKRVNNAVKIAKAIEKKYRHTKTDDDIKDIIIEVLRPLLWNDGESFIWILDYKGVFYLAPKYLKDKEGKSVINFKDATGREVIKEEIKLCKDKGEGFLWDTFTRQNHDKNKQFKQLAFVKDLGSYNWYMGSSEYLDTATKHSDEVLIESLTKIDAMNYNYVYIFKRDGTMLMHSASPQMVGKNMKTFEGGRIKNIYEMIMDTLKNKDSGYVSYKWYNPNTKLYEDKYTFVKAVPSSDWIVASGYYESTIMHKLEEQSKDLYMVHHMKLTNIIYGSILLLIVSLVISYFVSKYIREAFIKYQKQITSKAKELEILNNSLETKVNKRTQQLLEATKELEKIAKTDFLTKAHNRYSIMEILQLEISRHNRHKRALSVAMIDIDWFKKINDKYGHDKGDLVLIDTVKLFNINLRDVDCIGRYGGEEFLIIMPDTKIADAKITMDRIMKNISTYDFGLDYQVTISAGLVEYEDNESYESLLKRADELLYISKEKGRNLLSTKQ